MRTLLLDKVDWDLVLDVAGNMALADEPYGQAQDAACQIKLFRGELWYDVEQGIPYYQQILGHAPPSSLLQARLNAAALLVPGVVNARTFIESFLDRTIKGQVQIVNDENVAAEAGF